MHKIKHAARQSAWYRTEDDTGPRTYNFFGRMDTRPKTRTDLERGNLRQVVTETDAPSPIADRRIDNANTENAPYRGPTKSSTYSDPPLRSSPTPDADNDAALVSSTEKTPASDETDRPYQQNDTFTESAVASSTQKPRRRKFLNFMHKGDDDSAAQQEPDDSKKKTAKFDTSHITVMSQIKVVFVSWINILLVLVPVGIALNYALGDSNTDRIIVFVINFIAIIPLASLLSYATEELAMYIGEVLGGLLNATFGNAVELIVSIIALIKKETLIVQTSLIGSMLSNLLLVMGMCFFFGGLNRKEQHFNITVATTAASLLALAIGSLIIPTAFGIFAVANDDDPIDRLGRVTKTSRGTAVLLLLVYACYLIFQLRTHVDMYNKPSEKVPKRQSGKKDAGEASKGIAMIGAASGAATAGGKVNQENLIQESAEEEETPQLTKIGALVTLAGSTVLIALCAEFMVDSIGVVSQSVSQEFIGLILLPIVGNAAEHATAVTVAIKDKMDLAIGVAVGSSLQIALLVLPIMIMLNWWGVGAPADLNLNFDGFLVVVLVISIWLVNYLIGDGKSHWLEGVLLMITYLIIAVSAWFYPIPPDQRLS